MKTPKFLFFADVNNVLFTVAYGLRQLGYEVKYFPSLALDQHFRAFDILSNHLDIDRAIVRELLVAQDFTVKLNNYDVKQIGQKIKSYKNNDYLIIGSDYAPLVAEISGFNLDVFVVTGADLISFPKQPSFLANIQSRVKKYLVQRSNITASSAAKYQKYGILNAKKIVTHSDGYFKNAIKDVASLRCELLPYPICLNNSYKVSGELTFEESMILDLLQDIRKSYQYIAVLLSKIDPIKGSSHFIDGFYDFVKHSSPSAALLLPKRGRFDLIYKTNPKLRELISSNNIRILPPISQSSLYFLCSQVDVSLGINYGDNTLHDWNTTLMQTLQSLCPLITYQPFDSLCDINKIDSYPHFNGKTSSQVHEGLSYFFSAHNRTLERTKILKWNEYMRSISLDLWLSVLLNYRK